MTKYCEDCKQAFTLAERFHLRKHVCDQDILTALAHKAQEEHKAYLERKRQQQEMEALYRTSLRFSAPVAKKSEPVFTPLRSSSGSSRRVSSSYDDDTLPYVTSGLFNSSPSYSSSSSCDSSSSYSSSSDSSSSDSGSCSSGD